jgi:hypothetical protein
MRSFLPHVVALSAGLAIGAISVFTFLAQQQPTTAPLAANQGVEPIQSVRQISYQRHEYTWPDPEDRSAPLLTFVYDVPYLDACGVFPPLHILNQILASGGSDGGMSPGATWEPFEVSAGEYDALVQGITTLDPRTLGDAARFKWLRFTFDPSFDQIEVWSEWMTAVCAKHREAYHRRIAEAQSGSD